MPERGTVYLIHFHEGLHVTGKRAALHYMGWTKDLDRRIEEHSNGNGSKLMAEVSRRGINWELARTWEGVDRNFERKLKKRHDAPRLCPLCCIERDLTPRNPTSNISSVIVGC